MGGRRLQAECGAARPRLPMSKTPHPRVVGPQTPLLALISGEASVLTGGKLGYWIGPNALRALIRLKSESQLIQIRTALGNNARRESLLTVTRQNATQTRRAPSWGHALVRVRRRTRSS